MDIKFSITKANMKKTVLWGVYILFFLFCLSLSMESYAEYEYIAGNIFSVITAVVGTIGFSLYFFLRYKHRRRNIP